VARRRGAWHGVGNAIVVFQSQRSYIPNGVLFWTGNRKVVQVPIEAVLEEIEILTPADELEAQKQRDAEEVAEFITRQVLERGATFFDG